MKSLDSKGKTLKGRHKNTNLKPKILKKKENNLKELLNKWEDKATFNRKS